MKSFKSRGTKFHRNFSPSPRVVSYFHVKTNSRFFPRRVSPCSSTQRNRKLNNRNVLDCVGFPLEENDRVDEYGRRVTTATQTTLVRLHIMPFSITFLSVYKSNSNSISCTVIFQPKTKHQRPYGWQKETGHYQVPHHNSYAVAINGVSSRTCSKYGSLPYDGAFYHDSYPPPWLQRYGGQVPPRTVPTVLDRHREVRRCTVDSEETVLNTVQETVDEDPANFSDDSLEDALPPPPPASLMPQNKRGSIAWEVSLESDNEALMIPGSTKVVGKSHRKSIDHSSNYLTFFFGCIFLRVVHFC